MDEFCAACFGLGDEEIDSLCQMYHVRRSAYEIYRPTWEAEAPARAKAWLTGVPKELWLSLSASSSAPDSGMNEETRKAQEKHFGNVDRVNAETKAAMTQMMEQAAR